MAKPAFLEWMDQSACMMPGSPLLHRVKAFLQLGVAADMDMLGVSHCCICMLGGAVLTI